MTHSAVRLGLLATILTASVVIFCLANGWQKEHPLSMRSDKVVPSSVVLPTGSKLPAVKSIPTNLPGSDEPKEVAPVHPTYEIFQQLQQCFLDQPARAAAKERAVKDNEKCPSGKSPITEDDVRKMLAAAARSGDRVAQIAYAKDPLINPFQAIANLDALRDWRDSALNYVVSGVNAGDLSATLTLAGASDPLHCQASNDPSCSGLLSQVVREDPEQSYLYYSLSQLVGGSATPAWVSAELKALETFLTPTQIAAATAQAKAQFYQVRKTATIQPG